MADNAGLDQIISDQVSNFLSDPSELPPEFTDWLPQFLAQNPPALQNSDLAGGTLTPADGAPHQIAWGVGSLHFVASASASDTQPHGLGGTPTFVIAFPNTGVWVYGGADAVNVNIFGSFTSALSATVSYFWLAIL